MALRHLNDQIAEIDKEMKAIGRPIKTQAGAIRESARREAIARELRRISIEKVDGVGIGLRVIGSLRSAGYRTVADLERLRADEVQGIGEERRAKLLEIRQAYETDATRRLGSPDDADLDVMCGGQLSEAIEACAAQERKKLRREESLRRRRAELVQRAVDAGLQASGIGQSTDAPEASRNPALDSLQVLAGKVCPRCKGTLAQRCGRFGPFVGCLNYPSCRYTRNGTL